MAMEKEGNWGGNFSFHRLILTAPASLNTVFRLLSAVVFLPTQCGLCWLKGFVCCWHYTLWRCTLSDPKMCLDWLHVGSFGNTTRMNIWDFLRLICSPSMQPTAQQQGSVPYTATLKRNEKVLHISFFYTSFTTAYWMNKQGCLHYVGKICIICLSEFSPNVCQLNFSSQICFLYWPLYSFWRNSIKRIHPDLPSV